MTAQREWFEKDYYAVLGVPKTATDKELSRAFKKLAKEHHPDANAGNAASEERFKEISAAYDVLGDATKRAEYDEVRQMVASGVGPDGASGFGPGGFGPGVGAGVVAGFDAKPRECCVSPFNSPVIWSPWRIWYRRIAAVVSASFSPLISP